MSTDSESEKKELCCEIDEILIEFFSTLTTLYQEQGLLEKTMKSGFINLSRARYSMGIKNVGMQQCDESKMSAAVKVKIVDGKFEREDIEDVSGEVENINISDKSESKVRRRNVTTKSEDGFEVIEKVEDIGHSEAGESDDNSKESSNKVCDPLKWFGVLVPSTLKQSQKDFKSTTDIILSIANLKSKLVMLQDKYMMLLKQKKDLAEK